MTELQTVRFKTDKTFEDVTKQVEKIGAIFKGYYSQLEEYYDNETNALNKNNKELCITQQDPLEDEYRQLSTWMLKINKNGNPISSILTTTQMTDILYELGFFPVTVLQRFVKRYRFEKSSISVCKLPYYGTIIELKSGNKEILSKIIELLNLKNKLKKTDKQLAEEYCKKFDKEMLSWE